MNFFLILIAIYILVVLYLNDFTLPEFDIFEYLGRSKEISTPVNMLVIYPHPDDETMSFGGSLATYANNLKVNLKVISVTHGEKGDELLKLPETELAAVRAREFKSAMEILNVQDHAIWEFADGGVDSKDIDLIDKLVDLFQDFKPEVIITYERAGLYGHSDHIELTKAVKIASRQSKSQAKLLFTTFPASILKYAKLPMHMATGEVRQQLPEYRITTFGSIWKKYRAAKQYKSQNLNHGGPLFLKMLFIPFEYITTKEE